MCGEEQGILEKCKTEILFLSFDIENKNVKYLVNEKWLCRGPSKIQGVQC